MDRIKLEKLITENMNSIFGFSLTRVGSVNEAECLSSDILYRLISSADRLKDEDRFYGFMWKIAENTYADYLRKKSKSAGRFVILNENIADESDSALEKVIEKEEVNLLRRELSLMSKQYRDTTVLYYVENYSCSEIAEKMKISTEMVKYYLFRARKIIREGMSMERLFGEKSYRPSDFEIDFWGTIGGGSHEYKEFQRRKIKGNILLAAYYSPVTEQEISIELGVALPYLEDEIKLLVDSGYLVCKNGKYLSNIPIFTPDCTAVIDEKIKASAEDAAKKCIEISDEFMSRFGDRFANENLARWQKVLLSLNYSLTETDNDLDNKYGELPSDGVYAHVRGGGCGVVWGRTYKTVGEPSRGIQGIYDDCPSNDGRGSVIAMNFRQTLNAQRFKGEVDPLVCTAVDCYEYLPDEWKEELDRLGYAKDGKPSFAVWTHEEYDELKSILGEWVTVVSDLDRKTSEIAASITADLAPAHIRKTAEYVGALVYRFVSMEILVNTLFDMGWLKTVDDKEKPAVCVVKN